FGIGMDQKIYGATLDADGLLNSGWFGTAPGTFTSVAAVEIPSFNIVGNTVAVYALGTDRQIYNGDFDELFGAQFGVYTVPAPGRFSSLAAAVNVSDNAEVLGIGAFDDQIYGALFGSSNTFLDGFFTTTPGTFRAVTI